MTIVIQHDMNHYTIHNSPTHIKTSYLYLFFDFIIKIYQEIKRISFNRKILTKKQGASERDEESRDHVPSFIISFENHHKGLIVATILLLLLFFF